jgi:hypothetical protein
MSIISTWDNQPGEELDSLTLALIEALEVELVLAGQLDE